MPDDAGGEATGQSQHNTGSYAQENKIPRGGSMWVHLGQVKQKDRASGKNHIASDYC